MSRVTSGAKYSSQRSNTLYAQYDILSSCDVPGVPMRVSVADRYFGDVTISPLIGFFFYLNPL